MITSIELIGHDFTQYNKNEKLDGLSKINIFIGANNSGKSTFLRALFSCDYKVQLASINSDDLISQMHSLKQKLTQHLVKYDDTNKNSNGHLINQDCLNQITMAGLEEYHYLGCIKSLFSSIEYMKTISIKSDKWKIDEEEVSNKSIIESGLALVDSEYQYLKTFIDNYPPNDFNPKRLYIPVLRGVLSINEGKHSNYDNYKQRTIQDYFVDPKIINEHRMPMDYLTHNILKENREIYTGYELYNIIKKLLLGFSDDREKVRKFEVFLGESFYEGKTVNIVPKDGTDYLIIKIGEEELPIYKLGDGVQAIILLTYPLFFNKDNQAIFFIDEPETHLHPGLQRIFIETLRKSEFKNYQYFITSHSNHFLDLSLEYEDISIFSFHKNMIENQSEFKITSVCTNHHQLLDELGVRNSSVFLANCTIWVEGITDRLYIRKFLEILGNKFKEDLHYAFIEYSGNNITHWSFLDDEDSDDKKINYEFITNKIFLIADRDDPKTGSAKDRRRKKLKTKLGENFYLTSCLEFENMLSKKIIKDVIIAFEKNNSKVDFTEFESVKNEHENIKLGKFIHDNIKKLKRKYWVKHTGKLKDKTEFCKTAISKMKSEVDLSDEAKKLAKMIIEFIKKSN